MSQQPPSTPESELLVVQEAAKLITRSSDPEPAIRAILRLLSQLLGLNRGRVLLPDSETGGLSIRDAYGLTDDELCEELRASHERVAAGLSRKRRRELGLE